MLQGRVELSAPAADQRNPKVTGARDAYQSQCVSILEKYCTQISLPCSMIDS